MKLPDEVLVDIAARLRRYHLDAWLLVSQRFQRISDLRSVDSPRRSLQEVRFFEKRITILPDFGVVRTVGLGDAVHVQQFLVYSCVEEFIFQGADLMSITATEFYIMISAPAVIRNFGIYGNPGKATALDMPGDFISDTLLRILARQGVTSFYTPPGLHFPQQQTVTDAGIVDFLSRAGQRDDDRCVQLTLTSTGTSIYYSAQLVKKLTQAAADGELATHFCMVLAPVPLQSVPEEYRKCLVDVTSLRRQFTWMMNIVSLGLEVALLARGPHLVARRNAHACNHFRASQILPPL